MGTYENKYLTGPSRFFFLQRLKMGIALHGIGLVLKRRISIGAYFHFLRNILLFYHKIKKNKIVRTRGVYKFHIYFPAYPTLAFWKGLEKFMMRDKDPVLIPSTSVLISMTKACPYDCEHCYQKVDRLDDIPIDLLKEVTKKISEMGTTYFNIEGGEPLVKLDRLLEMVSVLDEGSEIWVNTTGFSLTETMARKMKEAGIFGVMVSVHHWDPKVHDSFVGHDGALETAKRSLRIFKEAGLSTMINCTGTQNLVKGDGFDKVMDIAKDTGCSMVQVIHEKPSGGWMGKMDTLEPDYLQRLRDIHIRYNSGGEKKGHPPISSQAFEEQVDHYGCTSGGIDRYYLSADGEVSPCEFVKVSFGNIKDEDFTEIYRRMRNSFREPRTNWICCTERVTIEKAFKASGQKYTPVDKEHSEPVIASFNRGKKTPIYEKMGIYKGD